MLRFEMDQLIDGDVRVTGGTKSHISRSRQARMCRLACIGYGALPRLSRRRFADLRLCRFASAPICRFRSRGAQQKVAIPSVGRSPLCGLHRAKVAELSF